MRAGRSQNWQLLASGALSAAQSHFALSRRHRRRRRPIGFRRVIRKWSRASPSQAHRSKGTRPSGSLLVARHLNPGRVCDAATRAAASQTRPDCRESHNNQLPLAARREGTTARIPAGTRAGPADGLVRRTTRAPNRQTNKPGRLERPDSRPVVLGAQEKTCRRRLATSGRARAQRGAQVDRARARADSSCPARV